MRWSASPDGDPPIYHLDDPIRAGGKIPVVRHGQDRVALTGEFMKYIEDDLCIDAVQVAGRFVGHDDPRIIDQGAGDGYPLLLAAGQLPGGFCRNVADIHLIQSVHGLLLDDIPGQSAQAEGGYHDILQDRELRQQIMELENEPDVFISEPGKCAFSQTRDAGPVDREVALIVCIECGKQVEERGLPATRLADDRNKFAFADAEVDILQDQKGFGAAEEFIEMLRFEDRDLHKKIFSCEG